jgi:uncharacterized protein YuzE
LGVGVSIRIGGREFEHAMYDEEADVLYLSNGEPRAAASTYGTPEGHAVRFDEEGHVIGMTIVNAGWLSSHGEEVVITVSQQQIEAPARDLTAALERSLSK